MKFRRYFIALWQKLSSKIDVANKSTTIEHVFATVEAAFTSLVKESWAHFATLVLSSADDASTDAGVEKACNMLRLGRMHADSKYKKNKRK